MSTIYRERDVRYSRDRSPSSDEERHKTTTIRRYKVGGSAHNGTRLVEHERVLWPLHLTLCDSCVDHGVSFIPLQDGVLIQGDRVLPAARRALSILHGNNALSL